MTADRLKLAFVGHALKAGGGISVGKNLIAAVASRFPEAQCLATVPAGLSYEKDIGLSNLEYIPFEQKSWLQQWRYEYWQLPEIINNYRPDFVLSLANRLVPGVQAPQAFLLHDSHLFYPSSFYSGESVKRKMLKALQRIRLSRDVRSADYLLVQTNTAATRMQAQFSVKGTVVQLPNAVSEYIEVDREYSVPSAFVGYESTFKLFYLTRYYPHKNIELLLEVFERYPDQMRNFSLFLTIEPEQHPGARALLERIRKNGLEGKIINVGPLSQKELGGYFHHSDALVMPTTLESFSATYLEAMAFGTPIMTSSLDFALEICGEAAVYFDPWSSEDLLRALLLVSEDVSLRTSLVERGRSRLRDLRWSWADNAELIANLITTAMK